MMLKRETGSFSLMKNMNTSLIINIIRENGNIPRADVAKISGLTPATVSNITSELISYGIISEAERGMSNGGRKPVMLRIVEDAYYVIGVYIGTAKMEIILSDLGANVIEHRDLENYPGLSQDDALKMVSSVIREMFVKSKKKIIGMGVGIHGLVRSSEGIAVFAPNLGWENVRIKDIFESEFHIPVFVDNDVRAMALGESWIGVARGIGEFALLYIGRGIGGGIVINHNLYRGSSGVAGEIGHTTIVPDGPKCSCGNRGCLQALASEISMLENYMRLTGTDDDKIGIDDLIDRAKSGDEKALAVISDAAVYIGIAIANIINTFNPTIVVLSGRIRLLSSEVLTIINSEVSNRCMRYTQNSVRIVFSRSGHMGFLKGAATLAISQIFQNPAMFL